MIEIFYEKDNENIVFVKKGCVPVDFLYKKRIKSIDLSKFSIAFHFTDKTHLSIQANQKSIPLKIIHQFKNSITKKFEELEIIDIKGE